MMFFQLKTALFSLIEDSLNGRCRSPWFWPLRGLLWLLSRFYYLALLIRAAFRRLGFFSAQRVPLQVVCVGNLAVGGRGKTPFSLFLAKAFVALGRKTVIATRGYGSQMAKQKTSRLFECSAFPLQLNSPDFFRQAGDEALIFLRRLAGENKAAVAVGKDRRHSARLSLAWRAERLILDDGFQSARIKADRTVLLVKAADFDPKAGFLPFGVLRDLPKRAQEADLIAVELTDLDWALGVFEKNRIVAFERIFSGFFGAGGQRADWSENSFLGAFCALGSPEAFFQDLKKQGLKIILEQRFLDHWPISEKVLQALAQKAKSQGAAALVCTEKDFVKLPSCRPVLPVYYPELDLKIVFGLENLKKVLFDGAFMSEAGPDF